MDTYVKNLLISWNLPELVKTFCDEEVNEEAFKYLKSDMIKELIPKVGKRSIFVQRFEEYQEKIKEEASNATQQEHTNTEKNRSTIDSTKEPSSMFYINELPTQSSNEERHRNEPIEDNPQPSPSTSYHRPNRMNSFDENHDIFEHPPKRIKMEQEFDQNVFDILSGDSVEAEELNTEYNEEEDYSQSQYYSDNSGQFEMGKYEPKTPGVRVARLEEDVDANEVAAASEELQYILTASVLTRHLLKLRKLNPPQRTTIVNVIVHHLMAKHDDRRVPPHVFKIWAFAIQSVFPTENFEVYYRIQIKRSGQHYTAGKLYDKHQNLRRKVSNRKNNFASELAEGHMGYVDEKSLISKLKLSKTVDEARETWISSIKTRETMMQGYQNLIYFNAFPILKRADGWVLFRDEFDYIYPDYKRTFVANWSTIAKKIIRYAEKSNVPDAIEEFSPLNYELNIMNSAFFFLPYLFKNSPKKYDWLPSKFEALQDFIIHVQDLSELTTALSNHEQLLKSWDQEPLPLIATVGQSISQLEIIYVRVNKIFYKFPTLVEAVEACIKIYVAMHLPYRLESGYVWLFLQKFVMGLELPTNNFTSVVYNLINELN